MYITGKYVSHVRTGRDVSFVWLFPFVLNHARARLAAVGNRDTLRPSELRALLCQYPGPPAILLLLVDDASINLLIGWERSRQLTVMGSRLSA